MTQTTSRKPLKVVKNGARPEERWTGSISGALHRAIHTLSAEQLRQEVNTLGLLNRVNNEHLWKRLTVPGKEVVRYHVDTDSEDASGAESEEEGEEEESASDSDAREDGDSGRKETKPIAIRNDEMTPRYANCENCNEEFDVTLNERGDCVWHSGKWLRFRTRDPDLIDPQGRKAFTTTVIFGPITTLIATVNLAILKMTQTLRKGSSGIAATSLEMRKVVSQQSTRPRSILLPHRRR
jgi:hypothetical protein